MTAADQVDDVVVITGAGGMGLAIARRLGSGRQLVLADHSAGALEAAGRTLREEGHRVTEVPTDVSSEAQVAELAAVAAGLGRLVAVVHTAGVSPLQADPERIVLVDVVGTALVLDAFLPHVVAGTTAICIASMAGTFASVPPEVEHLLAITPTAELAGLDVLDPSKLDQGTAYTIAKRANQQRVRAMSVPWGRRGGRVVSVSPGIISTAMGRAELDGPSGDGMRMMIQASAARRPGTPDDIAAAVEFLASREASFITGVDLLVDGGAVAGVHFGGLDGAGAG